MNALILVDLQNDFVEGGALEVPNGHQVIKTANRLMPHFDFVVATQDWHPPNHGSFASQHDNIQIGESFKLDGLPQIAWPDHCVQGTHGAEFIADLNKEQIDAVVQKGTDQEIDSYSGFFDNGQRKSTELEALLRSKGVRKVFVMGLATDYCVSYTAIESSTLGFATYLVLDGCRGVELKPDDIDQAVTEMRNAGITITTSEQTLELLTRKHLK